MPFRIANIEITIDIDRGRRTTIRAGNQQVSLSTPRQTPNHDAFGIDASAISHLGNSRTAVTNAKDIIHSAIFLKIGRAKPRNDERAAGSGIASDISLVGDVERAAVLDGECAGATAAVGTAANLQISYVAGGYVDRGIVDR